MQSCTFNYSDSFKVVASFKIVALFPRPLRDCAAINGTFTISGLRPWIMNTPACPRIAILRYQRREGLTGWRGVELLRVLRFRENRSKLAFA
jgi:hypothetical protein